jgi:hypothetical protein
MPPDYVILKGWGIVVADRHIATVNGKHLPTQRIDMRDARRCFQLDARWFDAAGRDVGQLSVVFE